MVEFNEKDLCLEIHEQLSWDGSVKFVFENIRQELEDWYENNLDDIEENDISCDDMDNCGKFLDTVSGMEKDWPRELKVAILKNIMEYWNNVSYEDDYEASIFDEDIIREGIYQTIEEEFNFDCRME
jgi:hypothetical protein